MHDAERPDLVGLESEAYHSNGYFTLGQAREHGVSSQLLRHYRDRGRFDLIRRGLYRIRAYPSGPHDGVREKWLAVGSDKAVVSHQSALDLLGLSDTIPNGVHVLVARRYRGLRLPPGTILHTHPDHEDVETVRREGLPVTSPARTLVDVAEEIQPEQAQMAIRQALAAALVTKGQLQDEAAKRKGDRASTTIMRMLAET